MRAPELGDNTSARRALDEPELQQVRLVDVLDRVRLLAESDGERRQSDRTAAEAFDNRTQQLAVDAFEAELVHLVQLERFARDLDRHRALVAHLGDVAHTAQDPVRDTRRAARASRDLVGGNVRGLDTEDARAPPHDRRELRPFVVAEPERHPETITERRRQQACASRRPDQRERRQVERQRARRRALPHDDVEPEILERRVEDLLDGAVQPVDLVDEEHVALLEAREDRRHVAFPLDRGAGDGTDADAELVADDERERRLPEARRPGEQDVVERLAAPLRGFERDRELLLDARLADEVVEGLRAEGALELGVFRQQLAHYDAHAAFLSAARTCSSTGSSRSTCASARSASTTDQPSSTSASRATRSACDVSPPASPIFSRSSRTTRCAVFLPMPGIASKRAVSSSAIARRSSPGVEPETIASATFGPTPLTLSR